MSHKPTRGTNGKPLPIKARVKTKIVLYDELGGAFQQLSNLYGLSYEALAERMILAGVQSHLQAIKELQEKPVPQPEVSHAADSKTNNTPAVVQAE